MSLGSGVGQLLISFGGGIVSWYFLNSCIFAWLLSHWKSLYLFSSDKVMGVSVASLGIPGLWWIDLLHSSYSLCGRIHNLCFSLILITHKVSEKNLFLFLQKVALKLQFIVSSVPTDHGTFFWEHSKPNLLLLPHRSCPPRVEKSGFGNGGFGFWPVGRSSSRVLAETLYRLSAEVLKPQQKTTFLSCSLVSTEISVLLYRNRFLQLNPHTVTTAFNLCLWRSHLLDLLCRGGGCYCFQTK